MQTRLASRLLVSPQAALGGQIARRLRLARLSTGIAARKWRPAAARAIASVVPLPAPVPLARSRPVLTGYGGSERPLPWSVLQRRQSGTSWASQVGRQTRADLFPTALPGQDWRPAWPGESPLRRTLAPAGGAARTPSMPEQAEPPRGRMRQLGEPEPGRREEASARRAVEGVAPESAQAAPPVASASMRESRGPAAEATPSTGAVAPPEGAADRAKTIPQLRRSPGPRPAAWPLREAARPGTTVERFTVTRAPMRKHPHLPLAVRRRIAVSRPPSAVRAQEIVTVARQVTAEASHRLALRRAPRPRVADAAARAERTPQGGEREERALLPGALPHARQPEAGLEGPSVPPGRPWEPARQPRPAIATIADPAGERGTHVLPLSHGRPLAGPASSLRRSAMARVQAVSSNAPLPVQVPLAGSLARHRHARPSAEAEPARPGPLQLAAQAKPATAMKHGPVEATVAGAAEGVFGPGEHVEPGPQVRSAGHGKGFRGARHAPPAAKSLRLPLRRQMGVLAPDRAPGRTAVEVWTPSMAEAGAVLVQAAPESAPTQAPAAEDTQAAAPQSEAAPAATAEQPGGAAVDLDALARDVYRILCRRLRVERERSLGRLG